MTAISALMTHDRLVTIGPEASVDDAARTMAAAGVSHLLVTGDGQHLLGVFCVCDLERAPAGTGLRQHLRRRPITVDVDTDATRVAELMRSAGVSCLPVVEQGRLVGIISIGDVVKAQRDQYQGEVDTLQFQLIEEQKKPVARA